MTVLVGYDPETRDRAVLLAVAAARFANVPLVIASVRAGMTRVACALDELVGEELERLRSELAYDRGIEVRTRVVQASTPAGVARGLQRVIGQEHVGLVSSARQSAA